MSPKNQGRPPTPDDAWASLDESDDWHDRSVVKEGGREERVVRTATNMRVRPEEAQRATKGPHLVVVAGAEVGRIYALRGEQLSVGRGEMNDVVLADGSVSRQHARLERRQGRWYVHDLDSGNGTFVQARRVRSAELAVGGQVGFGQVRLQLRESRVAPGASGRQAGADAAHEATGASAAAEKKAVRERSPAVAAATAGQVPRPALRPSAGAGKRPAHGSELSLASLRPALAAASRTVYGQVALGAVVLCLLGGWLALYLEGRSSAQEVFHLCQRSAKAFDAHGLDEAEQALARARALMPQHPRVLAWTAAMRLARADEERLGAARDALSAGDLATARAHLQALAGSGLYAKVEALDTELDRAEKALLVEAHTALQAGLQQEAGALLGRLGAAAPGAEAPEAEPRRRPDVSALARWRHAQATDAPLAAKIERWRARPHKKLSLWEQADGQSPALRRALAAFRGARAEVAGRLGLRALGRARTPKEQQVSAAMTRFATLWDTGLEEHRGKRAFAAIRVLTDAKQLATALGGEGGAPVRELNARLADMYYVVGMQAFAGGKLAEAAEALRVALALCPDHALSGRRMEEIEDRAVHMVDQAEFIGKKHPARAKELLHQVAAAMPAPSEVGARARRLLQGMGP